MVLKIKRIFFALILLFAFIACPLNSFAGVLFGKDYSDTLHQYFSRAENSIVVAMYFIILEPEGQGPVNELTDDLAAAIKRGVKVRVIMEDSKLAENRPAYQKLKQGGIEVYFDTPSNLLHAKGVAVDGRYLFLGSANWSRAAFEDNYEATSFEDSRPDAAAFEKYVAAIPLQKTDIFIPAAEGVAVPADFLLSPKTGRRLIHDDADKQLDLYLLLLKTRPKSPADTLAVDYDALAKEMGYAAPQNLGRYRDVHQYFYERVRHSLARLGHSGLIQYKKSIVSFNDNPSPDKSILVPYAYWEYGYPAKLSTRAKYMYLICLYEAGRSTKYPFWFRSQQDMAKLYGISDTTISLGLLELEGKGVIEITRDKPTPPDFSNRKANVYKMLLLKKRGIFP